LASQLRSLQWCSARDSVRSDLKQDSTHLTFASQPRSSCAFGLQSEDAQRLSCCHEETICTSRAGKLSNEGCLKTACSGPHRALQSVSLDSSPRDFLMSRVKRGVGQWLRRFCEPVWSAAVSERAARGQ
jgi:hypothetical protein